MITHLKNIGCLFTWDSIKKCIHHQYNIEILIEDGVIIDMGPSIEKGNFSIENIPPGTYEVIAWQEKFKMKRALTKTIEIKDSSETIQDFVFIKPEKPKK